MAEHEFVHALIERARSSSCSVELRGHTLAQISALLPFDSAMFLSPRLDQEPSAINKDGFRHLYWNYARNPERYRTGMDKGIRAAHTLGGAYIDTEVFSAADRRNLPLYAEMMRPQGINCQIVARPSFHGHSAGSLYLCRHGKGRFCRRDLELVLRLLPIIALSSAAFDALAQPLASPAIAEVSVEEDRRHRLTPRQTEIVELLCRGLTNREIGAVLTASRHTVRNHLAVIFKKLEVTTRAELVGLVSAWRSSRRA